MQNRELIWVEKEFAEKYKVLENEKDKNDERCKVLDEYIQKLSDQSKADFKANLESLEEDVAIYSGLMLKVKQSFEKAKETQLSAFYALWEKYEVEIPSVRDKVSKIVSELEPLNKKLKEINDLIGKVSLYNANSMIETVERLANSYGKSKDMIEFLVNNFKEKSCLSTSCASAIVGSDT